MSYLAPAGTPVALSDIAHGLLNARTGSTASQEVAQAVELLTGTSRAWPVSSGRAAMTAILTAMRETASDQGRTEVVIPAYTCYSVPAAIGRAGLAPRLCDSDPDTLGIDIEQLQRRDFSRTLAVVSSNLYGLPDDLPAIEAICRERGVFFLDDAAQALGAHISDRFAGTFGDAGLYSFDKGKVISTIQGGVIICNRGALAERLETIAGAFPAPSALEVTSIILRLGVYSVFLKPRLYPLIKAIPFTGLGETVFCAEYPITRLSAFQSAVATRLLRRLEHFQAGRRRNAAALRQALQDCPALQPIRVAEQTVPSYVRYPVRVRNPRKRSLILNALTRAGVGATTSYPLSLADVPEVRAQVPHADLECPGARELAASILTLPTHAYCPPDTAAHVRKVIDQCTT